MRVALSWFAYCEILQLFANTKHHRLIGYTTTNDDAEVKVYDEIRRRASNHNAVPGEAGQELGRRRCPLIPLP